MGGTEAWLYSFLTLALVGGKWSALPPVLFTPSERAPGSHWKVKNGSFGAEKGLFYLPAIEPRSVCRSVAYQKKKKGAEINR
jgi:hypothetical protein